jgi:2-keto-4-pentenoate hydratase/2-oxohepta-3-ene-1,7-dioic acid hydratase in catechol pathway
VRVKFATLEKGGRHWSGLLIENETRAVPLHGSEDGGSGGIVPIIANGAASQAHDFANAVSLDAGTSLKAPIPKPVRNIFCVGKNYADHARELSKSIFKGELSSVPIVFSKVPETVIGPGEPISIDPAVSTAIDYEGELAVIIGKGGRNIGADKAMAHVFGYTIINDVTARDIQQRHGQWLLGKSQDTFCPMGPWVVTADEIDLANTGIRTYVNGELRQNGNTRDLIFGVPELIAAISNGITLQTGDIIATGTPAGVGAGFDPPRFLQDGDVVRIEIDGIGALENPVKAMS